MNAPWINIELTDRTVPVPNRWNLLSSYLFLCVCRLLHEYVHGRLSYRELHIHFVCECLGLDPKKIKDSTAAENLYLISSQIDFIFKDPLKINNTFLAQLLPEIAIPGTKDTLQAYRIRTDFDTLTCSLTALQFIEAYDLIGCPEEKQPLQAAILYYPGTYNSEGAHRLACRIKSLDPVLLQAISLNFVAFTNFIFTQTDFAILKGKADSSKSRRITIGMAETLYNLSADGLGDAEAIEQLPVIKYLSILRKKLIESVRAMSDAEMDLLDISDKTGLSIKQIKQII